MADRRREYEAVGDEYLCEEIDHNEIEIIQVRPTIDGWKIKINKKKPSSIFLFMRSRSSADWQGKLRQRLQGELEDASGGGEGAGHATGEGTVGRSE
jgi:hypothetical protein